MGTLPNVGEIDWGGNAGRPIILLLPIYKNTIMTKKLFISSWFESYIGVCTLRSIVLAESAILREEIKNRKLMIFKKAYNSIPFQQIFVKIIFHPFKVSPWIIYLFSGFLNDMISFKYLGFYLGKTGVIERFCESPILTKEVSCSK